MASYTTQVASVSSKNTIEKKNLSVQMASRALMTADEIKRIPKGEFVVFKTGAYPMKVNMPLFKEWGINFEEDCIPKKRDIEIPQYISVNELKENIVNSVIDDETEGTGVKHFKKKVI